VINSVDMSPGACAGSWKTGLQFSKDLWARALRVQRSGSLHRWLFMAARVATRVGRVRAAGGRDTGWRRDARDGRHRGHAVVPRVSAATAAPLGVRPRAATVAA